MLKTSLVHTGAKEDEFFAPTYSPALALEGMVPG